MKKIKKLHSVKTKYAYKYKEYFIFIFLICIIVLLALYPMPKSTYDPSPSPIPKASPRASTIPSPSPSPSHRSTAVWDLDMEDNATYTSDNLKITFTLPTDYKKIAYDLISDYGQYDNRQFVVRSIRIEKNIANESEIIDFNTATSRNDVPLTYEGTPNYLMGKIPIEAEIGEVFDLLIKYYMQPIYVQKIYLESVNTHAYIVYQKHCYAGCELVRTYLIPWGKTIDSNIYHNLSVSFYLGTLATNENPEVYDLQYVTFNPDQIKKFVSGNFDSNLFPISTQKLMSIQDDLVKTIKILNN